MRCSVITPTYNSARFLDRAIESVRAQTHSDVEHIVVDGASSDDTLQRLMRHQHLRWMSEPDRGMYEAINKGLKMATGAVFGYLNADDRYLPNTIAQVIAAFQKDPALDFVYGHCTYIDNHERSICTFRALPFSSRLMRSGRIIFAQPTCFWRATVHDQIGYFDAATRTAGDVDFFLRLVHAGCKGQLLPYTLARFMVRADCLSNVLASNVRDEWRMLRSRHGVRLSSAAYLTHEALYCAVNAVSLLRYRRWAAQASKGAA